MLNTMNGIATLCPLEGGDAVYAARSLYELFVPGASYADSTLCVAAPQPIAMPNDAKGTITTSFTLYPNPATKELTVALKGIEQENLRFIIFDNVGKNVKDILLEGGFQQAISVEDLTPGVYYCHLKDGDKSLGVERLVIIR
jgi:hypothetical protein